MKPGHKKNARFLIKTPIFVHQCNINWKDLQLDPIGRLRSHLPSGDKAKLNTFSLRKKHQIDRTPKPLSSAEIPAISRAKNASYVCPSMVTPAVQGCHWAIYYVYWVLWRIRIARNLLSACTLKNLLIMKNGSWTIQMVFFTIASAVIDIIAKSSRLSNITQLWSNPWELPTILAIISVVFHSINVRCAAKRSTLNRFKQE